jgi:hypothetical protein
MDGNRLCAVFGRFRRTAVLALACVICIYGGAGSAVLAAVPPGDGSQTGDGSQARKVVPVPARAACGDVPDGRARCLANVSIASYSSPDQTAQPGTTSGYGPQEFHTAYNLPCKPGDPVASICATPDSFGPATIAIVDAGGYGGSLQSDLQTYDDHYGLPACTFANGCLKVVNQDGAASPLPSQVSSGWRTEIALDVQTAHMICQTCRIVLVEADDDYIDSLSAAQDTAASFSPIAISNSWGADTDVTAYDNDFKRTGMAVVAATGDDGTLSGGVSWPADIPQVVAAAGSTLQLNGDDTRASETVWSGSGGGCSITYTAPSWQTSRGDWAANGCDNGGRAFGDIAADANPSTGAAIVVGSSWYLVGGTSLSTPIIASMYALASDLPVGTQASTLPYQNVSASNRYDIISGNDCTSAGQTNCTASAGFDVPTGLGSPMGLGLFQAGPAGGTATYSDRLAIRHALASGESLGSSPTDPAYRLVMKTNGNLAVYKGSDAIWQSHTAGTGSDNRLVLKSSGELVIYTSSNRVVWSSHTASANSSTRPTRLVMKTNGHLVLYTSSGKPIWSSVKGKYTVADYTRLYAGHSISANHTLGSTLYEPRYRLIVRSNGNVLVYRRGGGVMWQSHTAHTGRHNRMVLQRDGNLVIYTRSNKALWQSRTAGAGSHVRLSLRTDGNLVLYKKNTPIWSSRSGRL